MKRTLWIALSLLGLILLNVITSCGGGSSATTPPPPQVSVVVAPGSATVQAGSTMTFTATVNNDSTSQGVTWTISPATGEGTLTNATSTSVDYNAPANRPAGDLSVTITAASKADASKAGSATVTVPGGILVSLTSSVGVEAGGTVPITATVTNDPSSQGVTWALSPATGAGTLSNMTSTTVVYHAPSTPPASDRDVTITATSVADTSKSGSTTVTVLAISVSISPSASTVQAGDTASITATVDNDPSNQGVTWALSPASGAGTLTNMTSTTVVYNAPATPPTSNQTVTITATSVADASKSSSQDVVVLAITVAVAPATASLPVNSTQQFIATVQNDPGSKNVNWTLTQGGAACSPTCGTITLNTTTSGAATTYTAPPSRPTNPQVTLRATSANDGSKSATAAITIPVGTVKLVPASLDFGRDKVNAARALDVTLTNTGATALSITGMSITGTNPSVFSQTNTCGTSVASGASCTITTTFKPATTGLLTAVLNINDNSVGSPQHVSLTGTGISIHISAVRSVLSTSKGISVPRATGSGDVGTLVMDLVDSNRADPYLVNVTRRELLVRFWYPATGGQRCQPASYTSPEIWKYFSQLARTPLPEIRTNSCWNTSLTNGVHPIVVFTHGYTGTFTDYTFLFEDLASRGYVVASVDHTYEATAVEFPDGRMIKSVFGSHLGSKLRSDEQAMTSAVRARLGDLKFVVDELQRLNVRAGSPFKDKLDMSRVALAGHSLGGLTAILSVEREPRFKAGIILDGIVPERLAHPTRTPVLLLTAGNYVPTQNDCHLWTHLLGPRLAVNLRGAEHITPTDAVWIANSAIKTGTMGPDKTVAAVRNYIAGFLDANLRGKRPDRLLTGPSSEYPDADVITQSQSLCRAGTP